MAASSSLSRIEFALNSAETSNAAPSTAGLTGGAGANIAASITKIMPSWMSGSSSSSSSKTLPAPAGASTSSGASTALSNAAAKTAALGSSAANSAKGAANKASHNAKELFSFVSSKVTGREHVPTAAPIEMTNDVEAQEGSTLLASSADPGGPTSGLVSQFSNELSALSTLSWRNRVIAFGMCATAGMVMLGLSFMFISLVFVGAPGKFALSYALANLFLLAASMFLVGPAKQFAQMFGSERALVSGVYLGSLLLLFYVSWAWSYFFIVIPVLAVQLFSLLAYVMSYVPFGASMMSRIFSWTFGRSFSFTS